MTETMETTEAQSGNPAGPSLLTFLIADVRGYTHFTAEHGDEVGGLLASRFADLCEEVVKLHVGKIVELRGDEALGVFPSARNALRAAVDLQEAFRKATADDPSLPLNVGIGLDAGEPIRFRGGYRGGAINLAARLCAIAGPDEILASEGVVHVARKTEGLVFLDRGEVTLKGLLSPIRVLQIAPEDDVPTEVPPLQTILATHPGNLPDEPTTFIGREREIDAVTAMLRHPAVRMVTLSGPGGTGKTRLALQVSSQLLHDFKDGAFFCDLAPLADPALVGPSIASVLGVQEEGPQDLADTLVEHLAGKSLLLVLDNFEHLLAAAPLVAKVLDGCAELHVLVTSRIPLHLRRENEYPVPPLSTPDPAHLPDAESLSQYEAVALFIQRARAGKPGFTVTNDNAPAVAQICARLDGLPLAIELAAARVKVFPAHALLQRLDSSLKLLTGGAKDLPTRQQTLRQAIDWSYSLLSEQEKLLFARLSTFSGGWDFEAAEAICGPDGELDVLEGLVSLVDKSLIRQEGEETPRFSLLETMREYATEKLGEQGDEKKIRRRHKRYYLDHAGSSEHEARIDWFSRIEKDLDNLRIAFRFAIEEDPETAVRAAVQMGSFWDSRGAYSEGLAWFQEAVANGEPAPPQLRSAALCDLAQFQRILGDVEKAVTFAEEGVKLARESGDRAAIANGLQCLAWQLMFRDDMAGATRAVEECLPLARAGIDTLLLSKILMRAGLIATKQGNLERATSLMEEGWALRRGDLEAGLLPYFLAGLAILRGDLADARAKSEEGLDLGEEGHRFVDPHASEMMARVLILEGDPSSAGGLLRNALAQHLETQASICPAHTLEAFARQALAGGDEDRAVKLLAGSLAIQRSVGQTILAVERRLFDQTLDKVRQAVEGERYVREWEVGSAMSPSEAIAYALERASAVKV